MHITFPNFNPYHFILPVVYILFTTFIKVDLQVFTENFKKDCKLIQQTFNKSVRLPLIKS